LLICGSILISTPNSDASGVWKRTTWTFVECFYSNSVLHFANWLQFSEKTIVFTTSYFLTPVLIIGICFVANMQLAFPKKTLLIPAVLFGLSIAQILPTPKTLLVLILLLTLILIFDKFRKFEKKSIYKYDLTNTFFVMIFLVAMLPQIPLTKSQNFQVCESERIASRAKVIEIAEVLDSLGFKRGTFAMGADLDLMRLTLDSKCSDFKDKSLGGILIAIAETGFPAASSFGSVLVDSDIDRSDFAEDNLSLITSREVAPTGCFIEWEKLRETSRVKVEFMNHVFGARITCVDSTSLEQGRKG
jgi:hypothetical protein